MAGLASASMDQIWAEARECGRLHREGLEAFVEMMDSSPERLGEMSAKSLQLVGYLATVAIAEVLYRLDEANEMEN